MCRTSPLLQQKRSKMVDGLNRQALSGQPRSQFGQPNFGFEPRGPAFGLFQSLQQQSRPAFQPLKRNSDKPSHQRSKPRSAHPQTAPPICKTPAAVGLNFMSKVDLPRWSRDNGLPCSHLKATLIEQAKTNTYIKTANRGK